ncbi:hypothetical protein [Jiella sp. M17.18]|uniref:hypothetical protein n=1 Tax=Jiella sp. M17.18 TaxID=3234247 RepID=UPI0034DE6B43
MRLAGGSSHLLDQPTAEMEAVGCSSETMPTNTDIDDRAGPRNEPPGTPKPHIRSAKKVGPYGPVFAAAEIAASRHLLTLLDRQGFALVPEGGIALGGIWLDPILCQKLATLGLAEVEDVCGGMIVRQPSSRAAPDGA